jgi:lipoprotein NlpD
MLKLRVKNFLEAIRFKYKVSILNENTLEETWFVRLSRLNVFLLGGTFLVITFLLMAFLILKTPLRYFLPGYEDSGIRTEFVQASIKADSLAFTLKKQAEYIDILKEIMEGNIKIDSTRSLDSIVLKEREELLLKKSEREKQFCETIEQEEQYKLGVLSQRNNENILVLFKPTKGIISNKFDYNKQHYGIDVVSAPNERVLSVLKGTVVLTGFTIETGYIIAVQHENDYISIYKHNSQLLKKTGDIVRAGEPIAIVGNTGKQTTGPHLHFELWNKGRPLNPEQYIIF